MKALPPAKPPFGQLRIENADHFAAVYVMAVHGPCG